MVHGNPNFGKGPGVEPMSPERVAQLPGRIAGILVELHKGYGLDGQGPNEGAVEYGQMLLGELLRDLDIDLAALGLEAIDPRWTFDDLPEYALHAVPAVAAAPNLTQEQKVSVLADYAVLLTNSGFAWTYGSGRSKVRKKLHAVKRGSPGAEAEQQGVILALEQRWRRERVARAKEFWAAATGRKAGRA